MEFFRFIVELHRVRAVSLAGVVEQDEMGVAVEFGRMDAVLGEHKANEIDLEVSLFLHFAAEGVFGGFAELRFAAGNAPKVGPFVGPDHKNLAGGIEDERADGGDGVIVDVRRGTGWVSIIWFVGFVGMKTV